MLEFHSACVKWLIPIANPQSLVAALSYQGVRVMWHTGHRATGLWGKEPAAPAVHQYP